MTAEGLCPFLKANPFPGHASFKIVGPGIVWQAGFFGDDRSYVLNDLCGVTDRELVVRHIPADDTACTYEHMFAQLYIRQEDAEHSDLGEIADCWSDTNIGGRVRIISKDHVGVDKHIVPDGRLLTDVYVAVKPAIVADGQVALQIGERACGEVPSDLAILSDGDPMSGAQGFPEFRAGIDDRMTADEGLSAYNGWGIFIRRGSVVVIDGLPNDAVVGDHGIIPNDDVVIDHGVISDPYILSKLSGGADLNIPVVELHMLQSQS